MKKYILAALAVPMLLANSGCDEAAREDSEKTRALTEQAQKSVGGLPAITNFYEKRLLKEIYERRDQAKLTTYAYVAGIDGRLTCLGQALGYGVPYSTQFSNPVDAYNGQPQAEPNGLFTPEGMSATWLQLVAPDGKIHVVYVEPTIVVSPFKISGPAVTNGC